jgi:hypothetical protein
VTRRAFDKIKKGLDEALAFARGEHVEAIVHVGVVLHPLEIMDLSHAIDDAIGRRGQSEEAQMYYSRLERLRSKLDEAARRK